MSTTAIRDSKIQIGINLDLFPYPDVCWIAPKMLWIHYLVSISHFAECCENQPVTVEKCE